MFIEKLTSSGLTLAHAKALDISEIPDASKLCSSFEKSAAMLFNYYDATGAPLRARKDWPPFYRIRYLHDPAVADFGAVAGKKPSRYSQAPGSGVCAYFPRVHEWSELAPDQHILITEGELKAAKACVEGFACIGIGGVYNFRNADNGVFFLPELEAIGWARRRVTIVYDDDYVTNKAVCAALNTLADELHERGALVYVATLPSVSTAGKTGLDDFLVAWDADALDAVLDAAEPLGMTAKLWSMNGELVYAENPGIVVVQSTNQKIAPSAFAQHSLWATASVPERKLRPGGTVSTVKVPAAPVWLRWPLRRSVRRLSYLPGQPQFCDEDGVEVFNQWRGWGCQPVKGGVAPWDALIKHIFGGAEKEAVKWFLDWCAWPLQHPGAKLYSAVIVHGRETGTGKSLIGYTLGRIYGANFAKIGSADLLDTWWAENRQFVLGDEITSGAKRSEAELMKSMVTQEEVNVNIKYIPQFTIPDCINYYLTSNHADALFLEDADRRYFVHEVISGRLSDEFYANYDKWMRGPGASSLFHALLQRDLSGFNPKAHAYRTMARERMVSAGKGDLAAWCKDLSEQPDSLLRVGQISVTHDMFTAAELLNFYRATAASGDKVTANGMSRALSAAGFRQVNDGALITAFDGRQGRYFAIRNARRWLQATPKQLAVEIKKYGVEK